MRETGGVGGRRSSSPTIGIGLVEHLGDIVAAEPVSRYLRERHPDAHLVWCTSERYRELLDSNPHLDEVHAVGCLTEWMLLARSGIFDRVVDLHIGGRVCPICAVPLEKRTGRSDITLENYYDHGSLLGAFCQCAGLPILDDAPRVYVTDAARRRVDALGLPERFAAFHTRSNELTRDWEDGKWNELASRVRELWDLPVVEVGTAPLLAPEGGGTLGLCGQLSILETAEVIRRAAIFVGIDSVGAHLANAVGTRGVVLLGHYRRFRRYVPYTGAYATGEGATLIHEDGPASRTPVSRVLLAMQERLEAERPARACETADSPRAREGMPPPGRVAATRRTESVRMIAFYLPQFHPIPENDAWWGTGFTEWTNVSKARPLFPGHYQPHLPSDLGFYDLRVPEVREAQARLAREHGIEAFCYYHYWFNGKQLLERPFGEVLASGRPDFPFCLAWANEPWTRRWDGLEAEVLQPQRYGGPEDDRRHFESLRRAFADPRYVRVDEKPLFLIYRPGAIPRIADSLALWRRLAKAAGLQGLHLVAMKTGFETLPKGYWLSQGFDAELMFQPGNGRIRELHRFRPTSDFGGDDATTAPAIVIDYDKAWPILASELERGDGVIGCVVPSWDNTARRARHGAYILHGSTPDHYGAWLRHEVRRVLDRPKDRRIVFLNGWNEWAEGNHLEPDQRFGLGYLDATLDGASEADTREAASAIERGAEDEALALLANVRSRAARGDASRLHAARRASLLRRDPDPAVALARRGADAWFLAGVIHHRRGEIARAAEGYETALACDPGHVHARIASADLAMEAGRPEDAERAYRSYLLESPDFAGRALALAAAIRAAAPGETAARLADLALAAHATPATSRPPAFGAEALPVAPGFGGSAPLLLRVAEARASLDEASRLIERRRHREALGVLERAVHLAPNHAPAYERLSATHGALRDERNALRCLTKAVEIDPANPRIMKAQARALLKYGKEREAAHVLGQLFEADPSDLDVLAPLAQLLERFEQDDAARSIARRIRQIQPAYPVETLFRRIGSTVSA